MAQYTQNFSSGYAQLILNVSESGTSASTNAGTVYWSLQIKALIPLYASNYSGISISVTLDGATRYSATKYSLPSLSTGSVATIASGSFSKTHSTDGSMSMGVAASFVTSFNIGKASISGTFTGTTIPRKTDVSLSASSAYFGNSITIYCAKKSSSFTNKLYYKINSGSWNVLNANAGNSMAWTIPMSLIANIPNDMSCTITVDVDTYNGSTLIGSSSAKITVNVPSSARTAPSLNKTDIYLRDGTVGITLSPYAGTWQHKIAYSMGKASGYIASSMTTNKSFTFRPPIKLAQQIPNANSGTLTITVYTYNGSGTHVGTASVNITVRVPSDILPSVASVGVTEAVQLVTDNFVGFVQNLSQLLVNISASGAQGSSISSYKTTIEGISYLGGQFTSGVIKTTGEVNISTTVTDSRGRTASGSTAITVMPYVEPSLEIAARADGNKVLVELVGSVSSVDGQNTKELTLKYKKTSDTYYSAPETIPLSDWQFDISKEMDIDASETTYEFVAVLTDKIKTNEKSNMTGIVAMSRRAGGKGVTFGAEATTDGLVSEWDTKFNKKNYLRDSTYISKDAIDSAGDAPSANEYSPSIVYRDKNGKQIGWIQASHRTNGNIRMAMVSTRNVNGATKSNGIYIDVDASGNPVYGMTSPAKFLEALGIKDYIIERGTSGIWTYRKWNSGVAECWGLLTPVQPSAANTATAVDFELPFTFISIQEAQLTLRGLAMIDTFNFGIANSNLTNTDKITVQIFASNTTSRTFYCTVKGRWK